MLYQGQILDGRNRYNACVALGIEPKTIQYEGNDPEGFVLSANLHRRHLSREKRRELIAKLLERHPDRSDRHIAGEVGVSQVTVGKVRKGLESGVQVEHLKKRTAADGKEYTIKPKAAVEPRSITEPQSTRNYDQELANELIVLLGPGKAMRMTKMVIGAGWKRLNWDRVDEYVARGPTHQTSEGLCADEGQDETEQPQQRPKRFGYSG